MMMAMVMSALERFGFFLKEREIKENNNNKREVREKRKTSHHPLLFYFYYFPIQMDGVAF